MTLRKSSLRRREHNSRVSSFLLVSRALLPATAICSLVLAGSMQAADPKPDPAAVGAGDSGEMQMPPFVVNGYRPPEPRISDLEKLRFGIFFNLRLDYGWPSSSRPFVISTIRVPQRITFSPANLEVLPGAPTQNAGIKLTSIGRDPLSSAKVTTQGAPYLLLFDGIPLRDPFTGSVSQGEVPPLGIGRVEIVSGAGASAWGNWAEGGVVHFFTEPAVGRARTVPTETIGGGPIKPKLTKQLIERNGAVQIDFASYGSMTAAVLANEPTSSGNWQLLAHFLDEHEPSPVAPAQRGLIDQQAWRKSELVQARWRQPAGQDREMSFTWRSFHEERNEGTVLQHGNTDHSTLSAVFSSAGAPQFSWQASGFVQWADNEYAVSAIDLLRSTEVPLLQVVKNGSTTVGGALVGAWRPAGNSRLVVGVDAAANKFSGEQNYFPLAQHRFGSGNRARVGLFGLGDFEIAESLHMLGGLRVDLPWEYDNQLNQTGSSHAAPVAASLDRVTPTLGFSWNPANRFTFRGQVQNGFREPTFGERFFQQADHATVTNSNSLLKTETTTVWQAGVEYKMNEKYQFGATVSHSEHRNAIAALAVASATPDVFTRQLMNLGRIETNRLELRTVWRQSASLEVEASVTFTNAETWHGTAYPGLKPAQRPSRLARVAVDWRPVTKLRLGIILDYVGARYADYENLLPLKSATILGLQGAYDLSERTELTASVRNMGRTDFESDRGPHGTVYVAAPARVSVGVKKRW